MNRCRERLLNSVTALAAFCALALGLLRIREALLPAPPPGSSDQMPAVVPDWREYGAAGVRMGAPTARVTIVEFSDFLCGFCKEASTVLRALRARYPRDV